MTKSELQLFIRSGDAWPGGYQCALMMSDGECIDAQSARENYRQIRRNMAPVPTNPRLVPMCSVLSIGRVIP